MYGRLILTKLWYIDGKCYMAYIRIRHGILIPQKESPKWHFYSDVYEYIAQVSGYPNNSMGQSLQCGTLNDS